MMNITAEVLEDVVGISKLLRDGTDTRVVAGRVAVSKRATLCPIGSLSGVPVTIIALSAAGIDFIHRSPLHRGGHFVLRVIGRSGSRLTVQCQARRSTQTSSGRYCISALLVRVVDDSGSESELRSISDLNNAIGEPPLLHSPEMSALRMYQSHSNQ